MSTHTPDQNKSNYSSGCPVQHQNALANDDSTSPPHPYLGRSAPVQQNLQAPKKTEKEGERGGCPVSESVNPANQMPVAPNQMPAPGQLYPLSTQRMTSTIPKSTTGQDEEKEEQWLYPSPQMFYNAMRRKGWDPRESDINAIVSIHNTVNEQTWKHILEWEELHEDICQRPRLARFRGRPRDLSPKARLMGWIGYKPPFDRHDWIVDRCGTEVRYVIDFYQGASPPASKESHQAPASSIYLDVRPALDSFGSLCDRVKKRLHESIPSLRIPKDNNNNDNNNRQRQAAAATDSQTQQH